MVDRRKSGKAAQAYKVLYFVNSPMPTDEQVEDSLQYGPGCTFRNAQYIDPEAEGGFEKCTAVAGDVPPNYAKYFPVAVTIEDYLNGQLGRASTRLDPEQVQGDAGEAGVPNNPFDGGKRIGSGTAPAWAANAPVT